MATKKENPYDVYFERLQACERLQDLDAITHDFHEALTKDVRENEYPMKYADLERQRKDELTAIQQRFEMAVKPLEHKLVPAFNDEYEKLYNEFDETLTKHVETITPLLNEIWDEVVALVEDQKDVIEMSKRIEVYRFRNYPVSGRKVNKVRLPFGPLNIDGDSTHDKYKTTMRILVLKYLDTRSTEPIPEGVMSKLRPDPMYFVQKATR